MTDKKTILIAEDDNLLMGAVSEKLLHEGFNVLKSRNGEEALKSALNEHPDLILLDVMMPKMDGLAVLKKLREDANWGKQAKVIMFSNVSEKEKIAEAVEGEVFDYLVKSDTKIEEVILKIREKLEGKQ